GDMLGWGTSGGVTHEKNVGLTAYIKDGCTGTLIKGYHKIRPVARVSVDGALRKQSSKIEWCPLCKTSEKLTDPLTKGLTGKWSASLKQCLDPAMFKEIECFILLMDLKPSR
ncbi:hypothetical protein ACLOJK_022467, partial [Asimina triloba]